MAADGQRHGGLADPDRALEQQMAAGAKDGEGDGELALATDDAIATLDLCDGGQVVPLTLSGQSTSRSAKR
jgi:hypothetical protein